jgi:hypothetical protein
MKYNEIFKLKKMLEENNIPFEFFDHSLIRPCQRYQICVPSSEPIQKRVISVLQGRGTYGGEDDLLEIRGLLTEEEAERDTIVGWLTAENVFERIKKHKEIIE